ncbi:SHOCT domain-containing protein, partial [Streptomyces synnematoformans]|uniref:SHOCT domain-containing protein n=1 Tax=Streptomyces synnematoformans TaxID=415721 RepID=UPI0031D1272E
GDGGPAAGGASGAEPEDAAPVEFRKPADAGAEPPEAAVPADDHDAVLRRLRELGELHAAGILTDEEFATAKRAILQRMGGNG